MKNNEFFNKGNCLLPLATLVALASTNCATTTKAELNGSVGLQNPLAEAASKNDVTAVIRLLIKEMGNYESLGLQNDGSLIDCSSPQKKRSIARSQSDDRAKNSLNYSLKTRDISNIDKRATKQLQNGRHIHCSQAVLYDTRNGGL